MVNTMARPGGEPTKIVANVITIEMYGRSNVMEL